MDDEEVYLRQSPYRTMEPEVPKQSAPEPNPTATVRHVRMVGKSRRWSMANRTVSSSSSILDSTSSTADLVSSFADSAISSSVDSSESTGGRVRPSFLHGSCYSYRDSGICVADV